MGNIPTNSILSKFGEIYEFQERLAAAAKDGQKPSADDIRFFIQKTKENSPLIDHIEDRRDLRRWLRLWHSFLVQVLREKFVDTDIDTLEYSPKELKAHTEDSYRQRLYQP